MCSRRSIAEKAVRGKEAVNRSGAEANWQQFPFRCQLTVGCREWAHVGCRPAGPPWTKSLRPGASVRRGRRSGWIAELLRQYAQLPPQVNNFAEGARSTLRGCVRRQTALSRTTEGRGTYRSDTLDRMYQLEVKRWLVEYRFPPRDGWRVQVDIDAMERANGGIHAADKAERALAAEAALRAMGVFVGGHIEHGRVDIVAEHPFHGCRLIEVEGTSSRQKEQAVYSALGQLVLSMGVGGNGYVLAVPDEPAWERQLRKIPERVKGLLELECLLVSPMGVRNA